jgi:hypothetical protein
METPWWPSGVGPRDDHVYWVSGSSSLQLRRHAEDEITSIISNSTRVRRRVYEPHGIADVHHGAADVGADSDQAGRRALRLSVSEGTPPRLCVLPS